MSTCAVESDIRPPSCFRCQPHGGPFYCQLRPTPNGFPLPATTDPTVTGASSEAPGTWSPSCQPRRHLDSTGGAREPVLVSARWIAS